MPPPRNLCICITVICLLVLVVLYQANNSGENTDRLKFAGNIFQQNALYNSWRYCVMTKLESVRGNHSKLWQELTPLTASCNEPWASILSIKTYANSDETKHHISPLMNTSNNTIVTLGIGHDTGAEENLIRAMGKDNLQFYGADPMQEINMLLYSKFGKFYPVAVAGKAGYSSADVLGPHGYQKSSVVYVDAVYFLTKMIGLKFFDDLWIDSEGGEYDMLPMLVKGGEFDQNGVVVCQMNIEMHMPDDNKQKLIHDFMFQMLDDQRYGFFFPINVGHLRIFFVNFSDDLCVRKYIPAEFDRSKLPQP